MTSFIIIYLIGEVESLALFIASEVASYYTFIESQWLSV